MTSRKLGRGLNVLLDRARGAAESVKSSGVAAEGEARAVEASAASGAPAAASELAPAAAASAGAPDERLETGDGRAATPRGGALLDLPISATDANPEQPRVIFDRKELETLKSSIGKDGILQPILVREVAGGRYQIVAGERRCRAAEELGHATVPALLVEVAEERLLELALVENIHRDDLNPIETAKAFQALVRARGWTQEELALELGLSRPTVSNTLRLLDLPAAIQKALAKGQIQMGHAKILLSVSAPEDQQRLFEKIAEDQLSVRDLESARDTIPRPEPTRGAGARRSRRKVGPASKKASVLKLEEELSQSLGTKVTIEEKKRGKGVVHIEFYSAEDFGDIRSRLLTRD